MGDLFNLLSHLDLSPVNTGLLAIILWLIWRLFQKFESLESPNGTLNGISTRLFHHDLEIAVIETKVNTLEDHIEGCRPDERR